MQYEYKTKGTCSQRIFFDVEEGKVKKQQLEVDMDNRLVLNRERSMSRLYIVTLLI